MRHTYTQSRHKGGGSTEFGKLVERKREELGLSQEAMAEKLGISRAHLSHIEHGNYTQPSPIVLGKASKILDISMDDLYVMTGHVPYSDLPGLRAYLTAIHPDWPEHVIDEIETFCEFVQAKHGLPE